MHALNACGAKGNKASIVGVWGAVKRYKLEVLFHIGIWRGFVATTSKRSLIAYSSSTRSLNGGYRFDETEMIAMISEFALLLHESAEVAERDASHIALMFFRVLEYEYSDNLLHPLIAAIDFDQLEQATGYVEHSKRRRDGRVIACRFERWLRGLDALYAVKTGFKASGNSGREG